MTFAQHFTEHPASVGETYGEHFRVAAGFAGALIGAAGAAALHAVAPCFFQTTASSKVCELHDRMHGGARGEALLETQG